jgi:hypothetical protein
MAESLKSIYKHPIHKNTSATLIISYAEAVGKEGFVVGVI